MGRRPSAADKLVAQRLRELRDAAGLSIEKLAEKAMLAEADLTAIENGGPASPEALEAIASALGVRIVTFFEVSGQIPSQISKVTRQ